MQNLKITQMRIELHVLKGRSVSGYQAQARIGVVSPTGSISLSLCKTTQATRSARSSHKSIVNPQSSQEWSGLSNRQHLSVPLQNNTRQYTVSFVLEPEILFFVALGHIKTRFVPVVCLIIV